MPDLLQTGKIVSTHGTRGEVKILPWADSPEFLLGFEQLYIDGEPYRVAHARVHGTCVLCQFSGIDDINAAMDAQWSEMKSYEDGGNGWMVVVLLMLSLVISAFNIWRKLRKKTRDNY